MMALDTRPPSDSSVRLAWTQKDQALLESLQERRAQVMATHRTRLTDITGSLNMNNVGVLTDDLILHAEALTKALAPFIEVRP